MIPLVVPDSARGTTVDFTITVNPDGKVPERSSENNRIEISLAIPERPPPPVENPDLALADPSAQFTDGGRAVLVSVVVRNAGKGASKATQLVVTAAGWKDETATVPELAAGAEVGRDLRLGAPEAQRGVATVFTITVDPRMAGDTAATNNSVSVTAPALKRPPPTRRADLVIVDPHSKFVDDAQTLLLAADVENIGKERSKPTIVTAAAPGWREETGRVVSLPPGERRSVELRLRVPARERGVATTFALRVNPDGSAPESNRDNNSATIDVTPPHVAPAGGGGGIPWWPFAVAVPALLVLAGAGLLLRPRRATRAARDRPVRARPPDTRGATANGGGGAPVEATVAAAPERVVNTGFSGRDAPAEPYERSTPLVCDAEYLFWLDIGPPVAESIELVPTALPDLPANAVLDVIVFGAGLTPLEGEDHGQLLLHNGTATVARPAALVDASDVAETRLFFGIRAPSEPGNAQLRCNIYHRQVLVQSRIVSAQVQTRPDAVGRLQSELDYSLAPSLSPAHLDSIGEHRLSVLLNRTDAGTHLLSFVGQGEFRSSAEIDELALQNMIEAARKALRRAAWGKEAEWQEGDRYAYADVDRDRLERDLVLLALPGFRLYAAIADQLTGGAEKTDELNALMRTTGVVQIALKGTARRLLPAALFYDYFGLHTNMPLEQYTVCKQFTDALDAGKGLDGCPCFHGDCPARGEATVVCPSGFWGFRHDLGVPLTLAGAPDVPPTIGYAHEPSLTLAVSTDPAFVERAAHADKIKALVGDAISYADSFQELLDALRSANSDVVYFYCHGGVDRDTWPYLQVGPLNDPVLTADVLFSERIRWTSPRPLVFINGCHTVAVEPEKVVEFAGALVGNVHAAGVIGTEITVFEPLATAFGLEYLRRFLAGGTVGESIRGARLGLLAQGNPLGLVYVPFALATLRLAATDGTAATTGMTASTLPVKPSR
jgi:hypothetical protein